MQTFTRGETIVIGLQNTDAVTYNGITAQMKKAVSAVPSGPKVADFVVTDVPDFGDGLGSGWLLTIPNTISAGLEPGSYLVDARVTFAGGFVEITDMEQVTITTGVTEA